MDKGKSPFCVEGEGQGSLALNISVLAPPSALGTLEIPEPGQFAKTTSTDLMQFWHGTGTVLDSSEWNIADCKAYSEALSSEMDPRFMESDVKRSGKDPLTVLLDIGKSSLASPSLPLVKMGGETSMMMSRLPPPSAENLTANPNEESSVRHLGCQAHDGSSSPKPKPVASSSELLSSILTTKHYTMEDLANLDPKRARRIIANRRSATKCHEKKKRQTLELEQKSETLEMQIAGVSTELDISRRQKSALMFENKDLKLRLQIVGERARLQNELTRSLRVELDRLRLSSGQGVVFDGRYFKTRGIPMGFWSSIYGR